MHNEAFETTSTYFFRTATLGSDHMNGQRRCVRSKDAMFRNTLFEFGQDLLFQIQIFVNCFDDHVTLFEVIQRCLTRQIGQDTIIFSTETPMESSVPAIDASYFVRRFRFT